MGWGCTLHFGTRQFFSFLVILLQCHCLAFLSPFMTQLWQTFGCLEMSLYFTLKYCSLQEVLWVSSITARYFSPASVKKPKLSLFHHSGFYKTVLGRKIALTFFCAVLCWFGAHIVFREKVSPGNSFYKVTFLNIWVPKSLNLVQHPYKVKVKCIDIFCFHFCALMAFK